MYRWQPVKIDWGIKYFEKELIPLVEEWDRIKTVIEYNLAHQQK